MTTETIAILVGLVMALLCGFLSPYILARRLSFLADTLAHGSLAGVGLGHLLGLAPQVTVLPYSAFLAVALTWLSRHRREHLTALTSVAFSVSVGIGVLLMSHSHPADGHEPAEEIVHILFGSLETISMTDFTLLLAVSVPVIFFLLTYRRQLFLAFLHEDLAVAAQIPIGRLQYGFMICVACLVAASLKLAGVLMIMTLITVPGLIASRFSRSLKQQMTMSPIIAFLCSGLGMFLSAKTALPTGPWIALVCGVGFFLSPRARTV
jgi:zinc transport system permease protein